MKVFYYLLFLVIFVASCTSVSIGGYCLRSKTFDIIIDSDEINKINKKLILNRLINESSIEYDKNSNYSMELKIKIKRYNSLISVNNIAEIENVTFITSYKIIDKNNNAIVDSGKIIIIDSANISDNRFANFATENYLIYNFAKNLAIKLENRLNILLNNKKCKKNQNEVAIYYFNANINIENTEGSRYV